MGAFARAKHSRGLVIQGQAIVLPLSFISLPLIPFFPHTTASSGMRGMRTGCLVLTPQSRHSRRVAGPEDNAGANGGMWCSTGSLHGPQGSCCEAWRSVIDECCTLVGCARHRAERRHSRRDAEHLYAFRFDAHWLVGFMLGNPDPLAILIDPIDKHVAGDFGFTIEKLG